MTEEINKVFSNAGREFELAWQEFFKNKPRPKNDEEERKEQEEFHHWYNHIRKQSDTGKTPVEMYKEIYGKNPPKNPTEISRMINFEWDKDYDEELIGFIYELQEYDNENGYKLDYEVVRKKLEHAINGIIERREKALDWLHDLLNNGNTWSCVFALEILGKIKSKRSIPYIVHFIEENEHGEYFESCEYAADALINMGKPAVSEIISSIEKGLKNKTHYCYLSEILSKIGGERGSELRLKMLKNYLDSPKEYKGWFNLTMFICDFNDKDKEALPYLKQLRKTDLNREESKELESAIEFIENPEEYERKSEVFKKQMESLLRESSKRKISRNELCPCGSGKKYKMCCLDNDNKHEN